MLDDDETDDESHMMTSPTLASSSSADNNGNSLLAPIGGGGGSSMLASNSGMSGGGASSGGGNNTDLPRPASGSGLKARSARNSAHHAAAHSETMTVLRKSITIFLITSWVVICFVQMHLTKAVMV